MLFGQLEGEGNETSLQLGEWFKYQMDTDLPPSQGATIILDVSTMDLDNSKPNHHPRHQHHGPRQ